MWIRLSINSILFLTVIIFSTLLNCNNIYAKRNKVKYTKLEVHYLPWNARLEIGCTEEELKSNKDGIASYFCTREKETIFEILSIVRECTTPSRSTDKFTIAYPMMILEFQTDDNVIEEFICDRRFFISNKGQVFVIMGDTRLKLSKYIPSPKGVYSNSVIINNC